MAHPLILAGARNFRDLGGHVGADGRAVRFHRLFRSDHLGQLTPVDLSSLDVALGGSLRVLDLRGVRERASAPCGISAASVHSLPIEPTVVQKLTTLLEAGQRPTLADAAGLMQDTYRGFVRTSTARFAALFAHVLDEGSDTPLVFHCTAGKDRTGFAAALLLLALGVSREAVLDDYLLTNERLGDKALPASVAPVIAQVLQRVQAHYLEAAFGAVHDDFGSLENYLVRGLGLDAVRRDRLRARYLLGEPAPAHSG